MKLLQLVLLTLAFVSAAEARTWEAVNKSGGKIVLTDRRCEENGKVYDGLRRMYTYMDSGEMIEGCWAIFDNMIQVTYSDSSRRVYDPRSFQEVKSY